MKFKIRKKEAIAFVRADEHFTWLKLGKPAIPQFRHFGLGEVKLFEKKLEKTLPAVQRACTQAGIKTDREQLEDISAEILNKSNASLSSAYEDVRKDRKLVFYSVLVGVGAFSGGVAGIIFGLASAGLTILSLRSLETKSWPRLKECVQKAIGESLLQRKPGLLDGGQSV